MQFGLNLMLFSDRIRSDVMDKFAMIREMGFDGVEVPVFDPASMELDGIRQAAQAEGLGLTVSGALPPAARFYGKEKKARQAAARYMEATIEAALRLEAGLICGPLYKGVGDMDESMPLEAQREEVLDNMSAIMSRAEEADVRIAFEPLNRFETNFMNTTAQGIEFCEALQSPHAGLLLDTFHMHIEEKHSDDAIRKAAQAKRLFHFHASENDRGVAGSGQVNWIDIGEAIKQEGYRGWTVLETFNQANEAIRTAVSCWRPFYPSEEIFMREGLAFVQRLIG